MKTLLFMVALLVIFPARASAADFYGPLAEWMTWEQDVSKVPGPAGDVTIAATRCPGNGAWGCADITDGVLYLGDRARFMAYHELGHFFDARDLNDEDRAELKFLMHIPQRTPWEKVRSLEDTCGDKDCPSEMFADAYANCALGNSPAPKRLRGGRLVGTWETAYGYSPTPSENRQVCALIRAAGA